MYYYALHVNTLPVGVLGASGYVGRELCALILRHPSMSLSFAAAHEQRGTVARIGGRDVTFIATEDAPLGEAALIFSALPHGTSRAWVESARQAGARVVDLSHDLRPGNGCEGAPYGLTELVRQQLVAANVVSNPGCYPTSVLLALAPAAAAGIIAPGSSIVVNSASGVTGAGNSPKRELLFAEVADDYRAYGVGNTHRHLNEMRSTLATWNVDADVTFTPHLLPIARGILSTIVVKLNAPVDDAAAIWRDAFAGEPFLEYSDTPPSIRDVVMRNVARVHVCPLTDTREPTLLILCAIDNLLKGAAGQAVQNANVMCGLDERAGLPA
jgi:N-acetyl-gamma-glutamyl-phosphate reductase